MANPLIELTFAYDESVGWPDTNGQSMSFDGALMPPDAANTAGPGNWCPAPGAWPTSAGDLGSPGAWNDPC